MGILKQVDVIALRTHYDVENACRRRLSRDGTQFEQKALSDIHFAQRIHKKAFPSDLFCSG